MAYLWRISQQSLNTCQMLSEELGQTCVRSSIWMAYKKSCSWNRGMLKFSRRRFVISSGRKESQNESVEPGRAGGGYLYTHSAFWTWRKLFGVQSRLDQLSNQSQHRQHWPNNTIISNHWIIRMNQVMVKVRRGYWGRKGDGQHGTKVFQAIWFLCSLLSRIRVLLWFLETPKLIIATWTSFLARCPWSSNIWSYLIIVLSAPGSASRQVSESVPLKTTPGKLRDVVENSRVCGSSYLL